MKLAKFNPPAFLDDLSDPAKDAWSRWIGARMSLSSHGNPQFFNPLGIELDVDHAFHPVTWTAFPKRIQTQLPADVPRWRAADFSRDRQDEYCEWSVDRDATGKITRLTYTCEGPEYWSFLGQVDPQKVLDLYREHVSPDVEATDLFDSTGEYITRNHWNSNTQTGAMHLIQPNNNLRAEIQLGADATVQRVAGGQPVTSEQALIRCSQYGAPGRHSDPHIGGEVNMLARQNAYISIADPVGLYIDDLVTAGWATPDGTDAKDFWRITRGTDGHAVRAVFEVGDTKPYEVGDIEILGTKIEYGAQLADYITIRLTGVAHRFGAYAGAPEPCLGAAGLAAAASAAPAVHEVADVLSAAGGRRG